jgi:hypothetical protein
VGRPVDTSNLEGFLSKSGLMATLFRLGILPSSYASMTYSWLIKDHHLETKK